MDLHRTEPGESLRSQTVKLSLPMNATNLDECQHRCDVLIMMEAQNLKEHSWVEGYLKRDTQGHHEVAVKHTCSAGETDRFKRKRRLGGHGNKQETNRIQKGVRVWGRPKRTLESIYRGLFPGSLIADC